MVKIRRGGELEQRLQDAPLPGSSTKNSNEKTSGENSESSHSNNAQLTSPSCSMDKQTLDIKTALGTQSSLEENSKKSLSDNCTPHSSLENEQTTHSKISFSTQGSSEENFENSHSNSAQAMSDPNKAQPTSPSGSTDKQTLDVVIALGTQSSLQKNRKNSPLDNSTPHSRLQNEQTTQFEVSFRTLNSSLETVDNSHSNNAQATPDSNITQPTSPSGLVGKQNPDVVTLLGTRALSEKNSKNSPSDDTTTHSSFRTQDSSEENFETSHSNNAQLTLLSCSVTCLPVHNGESHISNNNLKSPGMELIVKSGQHKYRGVTRHRWTGKYEAHLWDRSSGTDGLARKGKQVYLGGYETEEKAARAYDLTALKYWGPSASAKLNFPISCYTKEIEEMKDMSREEFIISLRRKSICFTRGSSIYRGVTRYREGQWQARIKAIPGQKDIYLGTFKSEEEAAKAYDVAAVKFRGPKALTNFEISTYFQEGTNELMEVSQPKRRRKRSEFATSFPESDPQPDESNTRPTIEPLLPEPPRF